MELNLKKLWEDDAILFGESFYPQRANNSTQTTSLCHGKLYIYFVATNSLSSMQQKELFRGILNRRKNTLNLVLLC